MKLEITKRQLKALMDVTDTISAMIGVETDFDKIDKEVKHIDKMLSTNGYKRNFK